jgi:hypothetical protein
MRVGPAGRSLLRAASRGAWAGGVAAALAGAPRAARAADTEPIVVRVEAPSSCPEANDFFTQVKARTTRARQAEPGERARSFVVAIRRAGARFRGRLDVRDPGGERSTRELAADGCDELVTALALIAALAIDPDALVPTPPAPAPAPTPAPPPAPSPPAPTPGRHVTSVASAALVAPALPALVAVEPARAEPPLRLAAGVVASWTGAIAPSLSESAAVFVEASSPARGAVAPTLRVSLLRAEPGPFVLGRGTASFSWLAGRLDACAIRLAADPVDLAPCAGLTAGVLGVRGRLGSAVRDEARPWVSAELLFRARVRLDETVRLEATGGASLPFVRDSFIFQPAGTLHEVPAAGGFFGVGCAFRFL